MTDGKRRFRALLFDAYGTLLDVHSISLLAEEIFPGSGSRLSALWREKQLQYTWLRTLSGRYADFRQVTGEALDYAVAALGLSLAQADRERLMSAYDRLTAFSDASSALEAVAGFGFPLAVLSNGTPQMLETAFAAAGLRQHFTALLSVDAARVYKTAPEAYQLALARFGGTPSDFLLVSSNGWDIAGAAAFGYATFWVNRLGAPVEQLGVTPTGVGTGLADLAPWLTTVQTPT
jgi:2-haloacid dehalogenase